MEQVVIGAVVIIAVLIDAIRTNMSTEISAVRKDEK